MQRLSDVMSNVNLTLHRRLVPAGYLCVAKVCESLGWAVNLKVKLESICAEVLSVSAMTIKCQYVTCLFKERGSIKVWSCLWKWIMSWTKEITEDLGKRVDVAHQARKGYKAISKEFGLHKSTVIQIVGNSRPLVPSREVVDQQRSLQSRTCNSLRGSQGNF